MLSSRFDAVFRAADALRDCAPVLLRAMSPDSAIGQSLERFYQAAEAFQASFASPDAARSSEDAGPDAPA